MAMFDVEPPADLNEPLELDRDETPAERIDRNFNELLQELRVSQTGVQILTGFLLTVPFTQRFPQLTAFQRDVFYITLLAATVSAACLIAPSAAHALRYSYVMSR